MSDDSTRDGVKNDGDETPPPTQTPTDFPTWFETLDDGTKSLIEGHTSGLKKALDNERGSRKKLAEDLRAAQAAAEKGSQLEKDLTRLSSELEEAHRRAQFYEAAPTDLTNSRLAWMLAVSDDLFTKKGDPDWEAIRKKAPELFVSPKKVPAINAGSGSSSQSGTTPAQSMNAFIRAAAGRS